MKKAIASLFLIFFPACLFAAIDLEKMVKEANKEKTPAGMIPRPDPSYSRRLMSQVSTPNEGTTRLYSTERSPKPY